MRKLIYSLVICSLAVWLIGCKAEPAKQATSKASVSAAPAVAAETAKTPAEALKAETRKAAAPAQVKGPMAGEIEAAAPAKKKRAEARQPAFKVWVIDGMQRVGPDEVIGTDDTIKIYAAKREWEPFQVIVNGGKEGLSNINMTVSDLTGPAGTISKKNITLYREQYLNVTTGSATWRGLPNLPLGPGVYADGLIPFVDPNGNDITGAALDAVPFALDPNKNAALLVDVFVPADTKAGTYKGTCTVTCNKGQEKLNIELKVWNFELPEKPYCRSLWSNTYHGSYAQLLLDHKIMSSDVSTTAQWPKINTIVAGYWGSVGGSPVPTPEQLINKQNTYPSYMWPYLVAYTADEISDHTAKLAPTIKEWSRSMHQSAIKNLIVMVPHPLLYDDGAGKPAVDIWVVLPFQDNDPNTHSRMQHVRDSLGCEPWTYNTLVQDSYSPKWQIDFRPIEFRVQTWINQKYGYNGLLYWAIDKWHSTDLLSVWQTESSVYPGDGWMVYPGGPVGLAGGQPSTRLKWLREGMDDYDYIQILRTLGQKNFAMAIVDTVGPDWTNWTRDPRALYNARKVLGEKIEQLMNP